MREFYFKEKFFKITDHYTVLDENDKEVYLIDQDFTFLGYNVNVKNLETGNNIKIKQKLFNFLPTFQASFDDGTVMNINSRFSFIKRIVDVYYEDEIINLEGNFWDYCFDIYINSSLIGSLNKKIISFTDQYILSVYKEEYSDLMVALTLCINKMQDDKDRRNN